MSGQASRTKYDKNERNTKNLPMEDVMRHMRFVVMALALLALTIAGCDREITGDVALADQSASNCFDCHSDQDFDLLEAEALYENSMHFMNETVERNRLNRSFYQVCEPCHTHQGFVAAVQGEELDPDYFVSINCFTCHAPHSTGSLQVRVEDPIMLGNGAVYAKEASNTCASCHQARVNIETFVTDTTEIDDNRWGPHHSVQADMLIGTNGYEYEGVDYSTSWHGLNIDDGCITCHMADPGTFGGVGGHSFAIVNVVEDDTLVNLQACTQCHEAFDSVNPVFPEGIDTDYDFDGVEEGIQTEIAGLLDSLGTLLDAAGLLDLAEEEPVGGVETSADSAGALYNWLFVFEDQSLGIHNTNYAVQLLQSSIEFLTGNTPPTTPGRPSTYSAH